MYINICMYTYIYVYVCVHIYMYMQAYVYTYIFMYTSIRICIYINIGHENIAVKCLVLRGKYTGWRRLIGCVKLQVIFRKRATN